MNQKALFLNSNIKLVIKQYISNYQNEQSPRRYRQVFSHNHRIRKQAIGKAQVLMAVLDDIAQDITRQLR